MKKNVDDCVLKPLAISDVGSWAKIRTSQVKVVMAWQ